MTLGLLLLGTAACLAHAEVLCLDGDCGDDEGIAMLQRLTRSHGGNVQEIEQLLRNTSNMVSSAATAARVEMEAGAPRRRRRPRGSPVEVAATEGSDVTRCFKTVPVGESCCFLINVGWADESMKAYGASTNPAVSFSKSPLYGARTKAEAANGPAQEYYDQPLTFGLSKHSTGFDKVEPDNWGPLKYVETKQFIFPLEVAQQYASGNGHHLYLTVHQNGQEVCNNAGQSYYDMFRILTHGNYHDIKKGIWGQTSNNGDVYVIDYQSYVRSPGRRAGDPMYFTVVPCKDSTGSGGCDTFDPSGISLVMISFRKSSSPARPCASQSGICCVVEQTAGDFDTGNRRAAFRTGGIGASCFEDGQQSDLDIYRPYLKCNKANGDFTTGTDVRYIQFMGGIADMVAHSHGKDISIFLQDRVSVYVSVGTLFAQWKVQGNTCDSLCTNAGGFPNAVDLLDDGGGCKATSGALFQSTSTGLIKVQGFGRIDGYFIWFKEYWKSATGAPQNGMQVCGKDPEKYCKAIPGTGGVYSIGKYFYEGAWYVDSGLLQLSSAAPTSRGNAIAAMEVSVMNGLDRGDGGVVFQQPYYSARGYPYQLAMVNPFTSCANYDDLKSSVLVHYSTGGATETRISAVKTLGNWWYQADGPDQYAPQSTSEFVLIQGCDDSLKPHQGGTITDATVLQGGFQSGGSVICPCCYGTGWVNYCGDVKVSRVHVPFTYHSTETYGLLAPKWTSGMRIYNQLYKDVIIDDLGHNQDGARNSRIGRAVAVTFNDGSGMQFDANAMAFNDWKVYPAAETSDDSGSLLVKASKSGNSGSYVYPSFDVTGLAVTLNAGGKCKGLAWACLRVAPTSACYVGTGSNCAPHRYDSTSKPECNGKKPPESTGVSCEGIDNCKIKWAWKSTVPTGYSGC